MRSTEICRKYSSEDPTDRDFCDDFPGYPNTWLCQEMEGDCDDDAHCEGSLECGNNNCPLSYDHGMDCCYQNVPCTQNSDCQSHLICDGNTRKCRRKAVDLPQDNDFCVDNLCQEMEGDCDDDADCEGSLECGNNNCPAVIQNAGGGVDCCYQP